MYIIFILFSAIFLGIYEIFKKISLNKSSIYEILFFYCFSSFILSLIFIKQSFSIPLWAIGLLLIKSIIIVINWLLVMKAVEKLDVSVTTPFGLFTSVLVMVLSYFIFDDKITWVHIASIGFIGTGIILVSLLERKTKNNEFNFMPFILLIIGTSLGAISAILDKYLISVKNVNSRGMILWFFLFNSLIYGIIYFIKNKKIDFKKMGENYWITLTGGSIFLADLTYYYSIDMDGASLSIISILRKLSIVIATILASVFLKEKYLINKLLILSFMLVGVALPVIFK